MKKWASSLIFASIVMLLGLSSAGAAVTYTYTPPVAINLSHSQWTNWIVYAPELKGAKIWSAVLTFEGLYDQDVNDVDNILYANLLPLSSMYTGGSLGDKVYRGSDSPSKPFNQFEGIGMKLGEFHDSDGAISRDTWTIAFNQSELDYLGSVLSSQPYLGLGFDSDCAFYYEKARLEVTPVPEPMTMTLMGLGLVGAGCFRKFGAKKS